MIENPYLRYVESLRSFYPGCKPCDLREVFKYKSNRSVFVCGNGPSLIRANIEKYNNIDYIGTKALITHLVAEKSFIFYETNIINNNHLGDFNSKECSQNDYITRMILIQVFMTYIHMLLGKVIPRTIIVNPQIPRNPFEGKYAFFQPFPLPIEINTCFLPYFVINEIDDQSITSGLRQYILMSPHALLNFKCSMVRAISFAYLAGYQEIYISGLDPSSSSYWYLQPNAPYNAQSIQSMNDIFPTLKNIYELTNLPENDAIKKWKGFYSFNKSIWVSIKVHDALFRRLGKTLPKIKYVGSDPMVLSNINEARLEKRISIEKV